VRRAWLAPGAERALEVTGKPLASAEMQVIAEIGSTSAIKQAVKAGVGVSVMSGRAAEDECRHGLLACVKLKDLAVTRNFYVVTHASRTCSPLCRAFLDFLIAEFSG
jgi:DNA-binding transcriptional LysR family regulator